ncbi:MAG: UTP--glucose-1-phosphate uridylyltransferase [Candidatus Kaiserbacteria bacterium]|nr:UTP--glucose-1-phosphate uridylyltransferase [Candidatus Kaiserbacteria bacterium]MCB9816814.1 UTP--glucose-1-phosphate uridylyltransferase [Candidatus Nomurabacteria bacterium]
MNITKAVIAVAGSGTRLLPATKSQPKEMLPIIDKPIIQYLVEELVEAGIKDIIMVTRWDKKPLEDHFDRSFELERSLEKTGKERRLAEVRRISEMANFVYVRQKGPYGNGTPLLSAANLIGDEPFVYAFGDDLVKSEVSFTKQLVELYKKEQAPMIGVQEVAEADVEKYGIVKYREDGLELEDIIEKPDKAHAPSRHAGFGRMILNREIVDILARTERGKGDELWIVDAVKNYIAEGGRFLAKAVEGGAWITTGDPENYLRAILTYAADRPDLKDVLDEYCVQQ